MLRGFGIGKSSAYVVCFENSVGNEVKTSMLCSSMCFLVSFKFLRLVLFLSVVGVVTLVIYLSLTVRVY